MTKYIAAYDVEQLVNCLRGCREIVKIHADFHMPATFFLVGELLEKEGREYAALLGNDSLFEIASHTYSHRMIRPNVFCGDAVGREAIIEELERGKKLVEDVFNRSCYGLRPACGFSEGLRGDPWLVERVVDAGYSYVSSQLWGPELTMPALPTPPYLYADEGFPTLWELPAHGWHENLLKANNLTDKPQRIIAWPLTMSEAIVPGPVATPAEEFEIHRLFIDRAIEMDLPYVSLIWHPWSLHRFDPEMEMLKMVFSYVKGLGMEAATFFSAMRSLDN